jgi:hypothetical protein
MNGPTLSSTWHAASGVALTDELLEWPPDLFAAMNVILARGEAFRFALSPAGEWPPGRVPNWARAVEDAGRVWSALVNEQLHEIPDLVAEEWGVVLPRAESPLEELAQGRDTRLCEALLTLHAIADEACAGLGIALDTSDGDACAYRAHGRELLAPDGVHFAPEPEPRARSAQGSHTTYGTTGVLALRLCSGPGNRVRLAQDALTTSRTSSSRSARRPLLPCCSTDRS